MAIEETVGVLALALDTTSLFSEFCREYLAGDLLDFLSRSLGSGVFTLDDLGFGGVGL